MKYLFPLQRLAILLLLLFYLIFFTYLYPFAFNLEIFINTSYFLYLSTVILAMLSAVFLLSTHKPVPASQIMVFCVISGILFFQAVAPAVYGLSNEYLTSISTLLVVFITLRIFFSISDAPFIILCLLLFMIMQVFIGVDQFAKCLPEERSTLITGTLNNSGIFACYIVIHIPLLVFLLKNRRISRVIKYMTLTIFGALIALLLYYTQSRTAIICALFIVAAILFVEYYDNIKKIFTRSGWLAVGSPLVIVVIGCFIVYYLFKIKKLSVAGRFLMLDIARKHIFDHFWFGTGIGRFTWYYPQWQAEHFKVQSSIPIDQFLSAGKTYVLFNEYLQLLEEWGIISFLLFIFLLYDFFRSTSAVYEHLLNYLKITVLGVLTCGLTSYPFHTNVFLLILAVCFAIVYAVRDNKFRLPGLPSLRPPVFGYRYGKYLLWTSLALLGFAEFIAVRQNIAISKWKSTRTNIDMSFNEKKKQYETLYNGLKQDGKFLVDYGEFLMQDSGECVNARNMLEQSKKYFFSYNTYVSEANACNCAGDYAGVIRNDEFLVSVLPNRFRPKAELAKVYLLQGNIKMAKYMANIILTMPVKKPSAEVDRIKAEMRKVLNDPGSGSSFPPELNKRVIISRDGSKMVFATNQSNYFSPYLLERSAVNDSFNIQKLSIGQDKDFFPESFSRDGRLISLVSENLPTLRYDIFLYDLNTRRLQNITASDSVDEGHPVFSPGAEKLAFLSDSKLKIYDYIAGRSALVPSPDSIRFRNLIWSATGKYLFLEDDSTNIWKYQQDKGILILLWKAPRGSSLTSRFITPDQSSDNRFYFISDHESDFNQIYKCDQGKVTLLLSSPEDKFLIQRDADSRSFYFRANEGGNFVVKKWKSDGSISVGPSSGVCYDYFHDFAGGGLMVYADLKRPGSLFREKKGIWKEILGFTTTDPMPTPTIIRNKAGMVNFVYRTSAREKGWVVWLHGGPSGQMSLRFDIYLAQLIEAGYNLIALNYPGSTGIGNQYEFYDLSPARLLDVQLRTIREDILAIKTQFPSLQNYSIVGLSHGSISAHTYASTFRNEVTKLIDFSGIFLGANLPSSGIPTLYIYGEYDFSIRRPARARLVEDALGRGNARQLVLKDEGHVINHAIDIFTITDEMKRFLN